MGKATLLVGVIIIIVIIAGIAYFVGRGSLSLPTTSTSVSTTIKTISLTPQQRLAADLNKSNSTQYNVNYTMRLPFLNTFITGPLNISYYNSNGKNKAVFSLLGIITASYHYPHPNITLICTESLVSYGAQSSVSCVTGSSGYSFSYGGFIQTVTNVVTTSKSVAYLGNETVLGRGCDDFKVNTTVAALGSLSDVVSSVPESTSSNLSVNVCVDQQYGYVAMESVASRSYSKILAKTITTPLINLTAVSLTTNFSSLVFNPPTPFVINSTTCTNSSLSGSILSLANSTNTTVRIENLSASSYNYPYFSYQNYTTQLTPSPLRFGMIYTFSQKTSPPIGEGDHSFTLCSGGSCQSSYCLGEFNILTGPSNKVNVTYTTTTAKPAKEPSGITNYTSLTLYNRNSKATPTNLDVMIPMNSSKFSSYEAHNLTNIEFFYSNGTVIPSWLESNNTNSAYQTIYWLKFAPSISGDSNSGAVFMGFAAKSQNLLNTVSTGEAPQLSTTYAQYDDGAAVFPAYQNFAGTSTPSGWNCNNVTIDDGLTTVNGTNVICASASSYGMNSSQILDAYGNLPAATNGGNAGVGYVQGPESAPCGQVCNAAMWDIDSSWTGTFAGPFVRRICVGCFAVGPGLASGYNVYSIYWPSNSTYNESLINFFSNYGQSYPEYYDLPNVTLHIGVTAGGMQRSIGPIYWIRIRSYTPGGMLPNVTISASVN